MTDAPNLLPCPFCGGDFQTWGSVRDGRSLGCSKCGARFVEYNGPPDNTAEDRLISKWNTRTDDDYRALMRAAYDMCRLVDRNGPSDEFNALWKLCKDYEDKEND